MNQSFQNPKAVNKLMVAIPGRDNGKQIWKKIRVSLAPSIRADSRMASGMVRLKKVRIKMMLNGLSNIGIIKAPMVSPNCKS